MGTFVKFLQSIERSCSRSQQTGGLFRCETVWDIDNVFLVNLQMSWEARFEVTTISVSVIDTNNIVNSALANIFANGNNFSDSFNSEIVIFVFAIEKEKIVVVDAGEKSLYSDLVIV